MKTRTLSELLALVEDPELFAKSEFGYSTDLIVVTQENMERLKSPSHYLSRPDRFLPRTSPFSSAFGDTATAGRLDIRTGAGASPGSRLEHADRFGASGQLAGGGVFGCP